MNILAVDPATKTGWALWNSEQTECLKSGCFDLSQKKGESDGMKWLRFERWLTHLCTSNKIEVIAAERVSGRGPAAIIHHAKLLGVIEKLGVVLGIETKQFSAKEIKLFGTGKGNADKLAMVESAQQRYDWTGTDDNEADALHLLFLIKSQI